MVQTFQCAAVIGDKPSYTVRKLDCVRRTIKPTVRLSIRPSDRLFNCSSDHAGDCQTICPTIHGTLTVTAC